MEKYIFYWGIILGIAFHILIYIVEHEDDIVCNIINVIQNPKILITKYLKFILDLGTIALIIYLLIEYYIWIICFIGVAILLSIIIACINHDREMEIYNNVLNLLVRGKYEAAENILDYDAKLMGYKKDGALHSSLKKLIRSLKEKEGKRKPDVYNIYIHNPIQQNKALVPMSHYQATSDFASSVSFGERRLGAWSKNC